MSSQNAGATPDGGAAAGLDGEALELALSDLWILICGALVFFQQCGFALLEAGSVRSKNVKNILLKNAIDACVAVTMWFALGSAFEGSGICAGNPFIGSSGFFLSGDSASKPGYLARWFFDFAFSATAATVVSGAVAERLRFRSYVMYTVLVTGLVYPVAAHWVWSPVGWLSATRTNCATGEHVYTFANAVGLIDFSGSGVVHLLGGTTGLLGAWLLGPRRGRYTSDGVLVEMVGCNPANAVLGTFILWFGWYGFNPGSTKCMYGCMELASRIAVNTTLGAGAGGLTTLALCIALGMPGDIGPLLNGILAGLVSITGPCAVVAPWSAFVIGIVGGFVYTSSSKFILHKLRIDDPLEVSSVHGCCGAWGLIAGGLFATQGGVQAAYGSTEGFGLFFGGNIAQLGVQLLGAVCIAGWSAVVCGSLFFLLKKAGWLRCTTEAEQRGLDYAQSVGAGTAFWFLKPIKLKSEDDVAQLANASHASSAL